MRLTTLQCSILLALVRYRFLTCSQLKLAGLGSLSAIRRAVRALTLFSHPAQLIQVHTFPPTARLGKLENVYTITEYGLVFLQEMAPGYTSRSTLAPVHNIFELDYAHRFETICFHIRLENELRNKCSTSYEIESYANYFEKYGANHSHTPTMPLQAATKTFFPSGASGVPEKYFIPDSVFLLSDHEKRGLFTFECVMGSKKTRTIQQIRRHQYAISEGILAEQYRLENQDFRALFLFRTENAMKHVLGALQAERSFGPFRNHIFFACLDDTKRDVVGCWQKVGDDQYLYNFIDGKISYHITT